MSRAKSWHALPEPRATENVFPSWQAVARFPVPDPARLPAVLEQVQGRINKLRRARAKRRDIRPLRRRYTPDAILIERGDSRG